MYIQRNNAENRLVELVKSLKGDIEQHMALHFRLSKLQPEYQSEFQIRIAVNILNDLFREEAGVIFPTKDGDIFTVYHGTDKALMQQAINQVCYLFADDPYVTLDDGKHNPEFAITYDLALQWRIFHQICQDRFEVASQTPEKAAAQLASRSEFSPAELARLIPKLDDVEFNSIIRKQPIMAIPKGGGVKPVYNELYVSMQHLAEQLQVPYALHSSPWLFKHLLQHVDLKVLALLQDMPEEHLAEPISLNLAMHTVVRDEFADFCRFVKELPKPITILMELHIADVFSNSYMVSEVIAVAKKYNLRLCLDGLTKDNFLQVDRELMGFDMLKVQWNKSMRDTLNEAEKQRIQSAIERCGPTRMVLCWCDDKNATNYGHDQGVTLFQGHYPDELLEKGK